MKLIILLALSIITTYSQNILFDGKFNDWSDIPVYSDPTGDGNVYDFINFSVTDDEKFLYIRLKVTPEFKILENNSISLYIDTDNNSATGGGINSIGADLIWNFGQRTGTFYSPASVSIRHNNILFRALPTHTAEEYEIAIGKVIVSGKALFPSDTIKIQFRDNSVNGDWMPNTGTIYSYTLRNIPVDYNPVNITREDNNLLRLMEYNVLFDGITDPARAQYYTRILRAFNPDIICFNEVFNSSAPQVKGVLDTILPLGTAAGWRTVKLDGGNVTASKYPVLQSWVVLSGSRITASLIDLSSKYQKNILVINCHYKCCGSASDNARRQREADATIKFILDAKTAGGLITVPEGTPIVIVGDLNLVGDFQQLKTLLTGQIVNTAEFGVGAPPDWDDSTLEDLYSYHTDKNFAYTWRDDTNTFPPGRLDFIIYTNSVVNISKSFILQTEVMSDDRLQQYNLNRNDTKNASDHLPKAADITVPVINNVKQSGTSFNYNLLQNYPNPFNPVTTIEYTLSAYTHVSIKIYDAAGNEVKQLINETKGAGNYNEQFNGEGLASGIYFCRLQTEGFSKMIKLVLLK
jgi:exonuclease III